MSGSEQVVLYNRRLRFHEELKFVSIKLTFRLSSYTLLISLLENVHIYMVWKVRTSRYYYRMRRRYLVRSTFLCN